MCGRNACVCARAGGAQVNRLSKFAMNIGLAFQVHTEREGEKMRKTGGEGEREDAQARERRRGVTPLPSLASSCGCAST